MALSAVLREVRMLTGMKCRMTGITVIFSGTSVVAGVTGAVACSAV
jgi:hypothetical protein